jgi:hypothetical protein
MRWVLVVVLSGLLVACGGDDGPSAEEIAARDATEQLLTQVQNGQYADAWASLHPEYQAVIPQELLVSCGEEFPAAFATYEIDDADQRQYVAAEIGTVDAWSIGLSFELTDAFRNPDGTVGASSRTMQFMQVGDDWTWFPADGELQTFKDGNCGLPWPGGSR